MSGEKRRDLSGIPVFVCLTAAVCGLILFPADSSSAAQAGLRMGAGVIMPSLFPFFVISSVLINTGGADRLGDALSPVLGRLFSISRAGASAFVIGLLGGYPSGAKAVAGMYEGGSCTKDEAERLLGFANNSGPAFILGACGGVFGSASDGLLLLVSHILAAVAVGIIFRRGGPVARFAKKRPEEYDDLPTAFVKAVKSSVMSIIEICGFVIFFEVMMAILENAGLLPDGVLGTFLRGGIELTSGVLRLGGCEPTVALPMASFFIGWGGLCVHCQAMSFTLPLGLRPGRYFLGKLLHGLISAGMTLLLCLTVR
jgi:sporulation integral membrane protein YlbJ